MTDFFSWFKIVSLNGRCYEQRWNISLEIFCKIKFALWCNSITNLCHHSKCGCSSTDYLADFWVKSDFRVCCCAVGGGGRVSRRWFWNELVWDGRGAGRARAPAEPPPERQVSIWTCLVNTSNQLGGISHNSPGPVVWSLQSAVSVSCHVTLWLIGTSGRCLLMLQTLLSGI